MNKTKTANFRPPPRAAPQRHGPSDKTPVSDVPRFLAKLIGGRMLKQGGPGTTPHFRHD